MPLLFLFPLYSVASLGLRHALCYLVCKNKTFSTNLFLYKFLWHKQQICCFKKIYKYPFSSVQISPVFPTPFIIFNCTWSASSFSSISLPPSRSQPNLFMYSFALEAVRGGGPLLRRSLYRERVVVGRGDESSSSLCMEKVGSFHSSLLLTSIGFGVWEVGAQALSHSSSH